MRWPLLILVLAACAPNPKSFYQSGFRVREYKGEFWQYNVVVRETWANSACLERITVLTALPRLSIRETVQHAEARDLGCNETIELVRFRYPEDEAEDGARLRETINFAADRIVHGF